MSRNDQSTKDALLAAAMRIFAQKGFLAATVRDICSLAGANVAAVNYHFGGKEALYGAVLDVIFELDQVWGREQSWNKPEYSPEEQIRAFFEQFAHEIYDDKDVEGFSKDQWAIFLMEMANPSKYLDGIVSSRVQHDADLLRETVQNFFGGKADNMTVMNCTLSIWSQLLDPLVLSPITDRMNPPRPRIKDNIQAFVDHMYLFTIGGMTAIREQL